MLTREATGVIVSVFDELMRTGNKPLTFKHHILFCKIVFFVGFFVVHFEINTSEAIEICEKSYSE